MGAGKNGSAENGQRKFLSGDITSKTLTGESPDIIALTAINRFGLSSTPAMFEANR